MHNHSKNTVTKDPIYCLDKVYMPGHILADPLENQANVVNCPLSQGMHVQQCEVLLSMHMHNILVPLNATDHQGISWQTELGCYGRCEGSSACIVNCSLMLSIADGLRHIFDG